METKTEIVYFQIKEKMKKGEYSPGMHLNEPMLMEELSCSRACIREVLSMLRRDGLVESFPRRGSFVTRVFFDQSIKLLYLQEAANLMAARILAENLTPEILCQLESIMQKVLEYIEQEDYLAYFNQSTEFHRYLCSATGNEYLLRCFDFAEDLSAISYVKAPLLLHNKRAYEEHMQILDAIRRKNPEDAEKAVRAHFDNSRESLSLYYQSQKAH